MNLIFPAHTQSIRYYQILRQSVNEEERGVRMKECWKLNKYTHHTQRNRISKFDFIAHILKILSTVCVQNARKKINNLNLRSIL